MSLLIIPSYILAIENEDQRNFASYMFIEYEQKVFYRALQFLKNRENAEDAVQETFHRICKNIDIFMKLRENPESLKALLMTCTLNVCRTMYGKLKHRQSNIEDVPIETVQDDLSDNITLQPEDKVIQDESVRQILEHLHSLPSDYGKILILRFVDELSIDEIARILDIQPASVLSKICRARRSAQKRSLQDEK